MGAADLIRAAAGGDDRGEEQPAVRDVMEWRRFYHAVPDRDREPALIAHLLRASSDYVSVECARAAHVRAFTSR